MLAGSCYLCFVIHKENGIWKVSFLCMVGSWENMYNYNSTAQLKQNHQLLCENTNKVTYTATATFRFPTLYPHAAWTERWYRHNKITATPKTFCLNTLPWIPSMMMKQRFACVQFSALSLAVSLTVRWLHSVFSWVNQGNGAA